jgi:hypothetical protein
MATQNAELLEWAKKAGVPGKPPPGQKPGGEPEKD